MMEPGLDPALSRQRLKRSQEITAWRGQRADTLSVKRGLPSSAMQGFPGAEENRKITSPGKGAGAPACAGAAAFQSGSSAKVAPAT